MQNLPRATLPTVMVFLSGHQRQDGLGVVIGLLLARRSRVLAVIGQLVDTTKVADRVTAERRVLESSSTSLFSDVFYWPYFICLCRQIFLVKQNLGCPKNSVNES